MAATKIKVYHCDIYRGYEKTGFIKKLFTFSACQSFWRGYCVRKKYQCRQKIAQLPTAGAQTLGKRYNDILDRLSKQKRNEYSYKQLSIDFWNLG